MTLFKFVATRCLSSLTYTIPKNRASQVARAAAVGFSRPSRIPRLRLLPNIRYLLELVWPFPRRMHHREQPHFIPLHTIGNDKRCAPNDQLTRPGDAPLPARHRVPGKKLSAFPDFICCASRCHAILAYDVFVRADKLFLGRCGPAHPHRTRLLCPPHSRDQLLHLRVGNKVPRLRCAQALLNQLDVVLVQLQITLNSFVQKISPVSVHRFGQGVQSLYCLSPYPKADSL